MRISDELGVERAPLDCGRFLPKNVGRFLLQCNIKSASVAGNPFREIGGQFD